MKNGFILEQNVTKEDYEECFEELKKIASNGDEGDILYEISPGRFVSICKVEFEYDIALQKFSPRFWFNQEMIQKLHLQNIV